MWRDWSCRCESRARVKGEEIYADGDSDIEDPEDRAERARGQYSALASSISGSVLEEVDSKHIHNFNVVRASLAEGDNINDDFVKLRTVDWMDWIVRQLWPHFEKVVQNFVKTRIEPELHNRLSKHFLARKAFKGLTFTRCQIGDKKPVLGPVRAYRKLFQDNLGIEIDCDMKLDCEPRIEMTMGGVIAGIKRLQFEGTVSVVIRPFVETAPIVGGVQMFFMNTPKLDFELSGALSPMNQTIFHRVMRTLVLEHINKAFVLPQRVHLNILKEWELNVDTVSLISPVPEGIVRVRVVSASNLPASDIHREDLKTIAHWMSGDRQTLGTLSDPFCEVQIGSKIFRSDTVERTVNPTWTSGATGDFLVYNLAQDALVRIFDNDFGITKDDFLGSGKITLEKLICSGEVTIPLELEPEQNLSDGDHAQDAIVHGRRETGSEKEALPHEEETTATLELEPGRTLKAEEAAQISRGRRRDRVSSGKAPQQSQVCLRAEYFALHEPKGVDDFVRFRAEHDGPSEALLGVKVFGLRTIGHGSAASDVAGKTVRVTLRAQDGSTTSFSSKPSSLRESHIEVGGVDPSTLRIVQNLRALNPDMPIEEIAAATEVDPLTTQCILDMHVLFPVQVNAGFFFCIPSHSHDVCFVELLPTSDAHKAIVSFQVPVSQVAAAEGMKLTRAFILHPGKDGTSSDAESRNEQTDATSSFALARSRTTAGWTRLKSSLKRLRTTTNFADEPPGIDDLASKAETPGHGKDHLEPRAEHGKSSRLPRDGAGQYCNSDSLIEMSMEFQLYSMVPARRVSRHFDT